MLTQGMKIIKAISSFADSMIDRMIEKMNAGYTGWDGEGDNPIKDYEIITRIKEKIQKEAITGMDWIDIANFAMMGWWKTK
jgi:hypothetical protein